MACTLAAPSVNRALERSDDAGPCVVRSKSVNLLAQGNVGFTARWTHTAGHQESFATGRFQARRSAPVGTRVLAALIKRQVRLEDRAESTSTTWVWCSRSCLSALVSDVRRGSGGEADPGQAPCGRRYVVGVVSDGLYGRQGQDADGRAQSAKPGNEVQRHPWLSGAAPDETAKRRSGSQSRCRADGMAAVGRAPLAGGAAHRTRPPRGRPLSGRSPSHSRAAGCGATTLPAM